MNISEDQHLQVEEDNQLKLIEKILQQTNSPGEIRSHRLIAGIKSPASRDPRKRKKRPGSVL